MVLTVTRQKPVFLTSPQCVVSAYPARSNLQQVTSYATDTPLPRVRNVEVIPIDQGGERAFYIRDPLEIAPQPLLLGPAGVLVLSQLDGRRTINEILESLRKALPGGEVGVGEIRHVLGRLSEGCYLDDPVAAARLSGVRKEFERAEVRPAWHSMQRRQSPRLAGDRPNIPSVNAFSPFVLATRAHPPFALYWT